jgi:hypothetical protein
MNTEHGAVFELVLELELEPFELALKLERELKTAPCSVPMLSCSSTLLAPYVHSAPVLRNADLQVREGTHAW